MIDPDDVINLDQFDLPEVPTASVSEPDPSVIVVAPDQSLVKTNLPEGNVQIASVMAVASEPDPSLVKSTTNLPEGNVPSASDPILANVFEPDPSLAKTTLQLPFSSEPMIA